jgi:hypothetical protein
LRVSLLFENGALRAWLGPAAAQTTAIKREKGHRISLCIVDSFSKIKIKIKRYFYPIGKIVG